MVISSNSAYKKGLSYFEWTQTKLSVNAERLTCLLQNQECSHPTKRLEVYGQIYFFSLGLFMVYLADWKIQKSKVYDFELWKKTPQQVTFGTGLLILNRYTNNVLRFALIVLFLSVFFFFLFFASSILFTQAVQTLHTYV